jgi:hypothetical protein
MDIQTPKIYLLLITIFLFCTAPVFSQEDQVDIKALKKQAPKVFIDCGICDIDYIRTEITFVNYVRDRKEAHIHILITTQRTGSGGREYTISFIGQHDFKDINDTHKYFSNKTDTEDEIREGLTKALKIGLMSYVAKSPIASRIKISYKDIEKPTIKTDKWNYWVFSASLGGRLGGEKSYKSRSLRGSFSASRITPDLKITISLSASQYKDDFTIENENIESTTENMNFSGLFVKSLNEHWSVGVFVRAASSSYENIQFSIIPAPAVEYNLFPYSQSTRRQLRFLYKIGFHSLRYREETIYEKTSENLLHEALSITFDIKEKWGSISTSLSGSHYFHDFGKNRINIFNIINLRLFKGLSFFAFGGGSRIRDQLSLPKGEAIFEEVLLRRKQIETGYNYFFSVGFSFTFGSIYTNVVNPRFGSSGHGGISIILD